MPTALPLTLGGVDTPLQRSKRHSTAFGPDLAIVTAVTVFGIVLTFLLTGIFPAAGNVVALALTMT